MQRHSVHYVLCIYAQHLLNNKKSNTRIVIRDAGTMKEQGGDRFQRAHLRIISMRSATFYMISVKYVILYSQYFTTAC